MMEFVPTFRQSNRNGEVSKGVPAGFRIHQTYCSFTDSKEVASSL